MIAFVNGITARVVSMELNSAQRSLLAGEDGLRIALFVWIRSPLGIWEIESRYVLEFSRKARLQYAR